MLVWESHLEWQEVSIVNVDIQNEPILLPKNCIKEHTNHHLGEYLLCEPPNPAGLAQSNLASRLPGLEGTWHIQGEINMSSSLGHS